VINWVSSCLSFFVSAFSAVASICTTRICTTTIIRLQPCGHQMLSFSISYWDLIKSSYSADATERGIWGWTYAQREGDFSDNSIAWPTNNWKTKQYTLWNAYSRRHYECICTKGWQCLLIIVILTNQRGQG
jgi:hypothetical protein